MKIYLLSIFLLTSSLTYSQLYILHYGNPGADACSIVQSDFYLSNGIIIEPIGGGGDYVVFDKPPTYREFVSYADTDFGCAWRSPITYDDHINININDCNSVISNQVLAQPSNTTFCDKISLAAVGCTGTQRFFWEYSTDGINYIKTNANTGFNVNYEFIKSNFLSSNYVGNIFFRVLIDSDPSFTEDNIYSNIVIYNVIGCSPKLVGSPITTNTSCNYNTDGTVTFTFDSDLKNGEELSINLKKGGVLLPVDKYPKTYQNKTYTLGNLAAGEYSFTYQTFLNGNLSVPSAPVTFTIVAPSPVTSTVSCTDVSCNGANNGSITISATGGTPPFSYSLDNAIATPFTSPLTIMGLSPIIHTIKVTDKNGCYEKQ